jgi:hypothetical protein
MYVYELPRRRNAVLSIDPADSEQQSERTAENDCDGHVFQRSRHGKVGKEDPRLTVSGGANEPSKQIRPPKSESVSPTV